MDPSLLQGFPGPLLELFYLSASVALSCKVLPFPCPSFLGAVSASSTRAALLDRAGGTGRVKTMRARDSIEKEKDREKAERGRGSHMQVRCFSPTYCAYPT